MGSIVRLSRFKKLHIPNTQIRVEILEDNVMHITFVHTDRPSVVCSQDELPSWILDDIKYMRERVSPFTSCELGTRFGDNIFYLTQ